MKDITFDNFYSLSSSKRKEIINDPLKLQELIKKNISEHRFVHSLGVADVCKNLARKHHIDENEAYLAGLLHDCCKFDDESILIDYLKYYDPDKLVYPKSIYHSWVAKYYLKEKLNFHNKNILNAIYNHTICNSKDKLSLILFIADKREPNRNIDDDILSIAYKDLYKAYDRLQEDVKRYLKEKNERIIG